MLPGIIYAGYQIEGNTNDAYTTLKSAGVSVYKEEEIAKGEIAKMKCFLNRFISYNGNSLFMEDDDGNLLQLIGSD